MQAVRDASPLDAFQGRKLDGEVTEGKPSIAGRGLGFDNENGPFHSSSRRSPSTASKENTTRRQPAFATAVATFKVRIMPCGPWWRWHPSPLFLSTFPAP